MKKLSLLIVFVSSLFGFSTQSQAALLTMSPDVLSVELDDVFNVDLVVTGLGPTEAIGDFDFDITWLSSIFQLENVAFGNNLDLGIWGSFAASDDSVAGFLNIFELSFEEPDDLVAFQGFSVTLATLTFKAIGLGSSAINYDAVWALGDQFGLPLQAHISGARFTVRDPNAQSVPEPETMALLLLAIAGAAFGRKRSRG